MKEYLMKNYLWHNDGSVFKPMYVENGGPEYYNLENLRKKLAHVQSILDDQNIRGRSRYGARITKPSLISWIKQLEGDFPDEVSEEYKIRVGDLDRGTWPEDMRAAYEESWFGGLDEEEMRILDIWNIELGLTNEEYYMDKVRKKLGMPKPDKASRS